MNRSDSTSKALLEASLDCIFVLAAVTDEQGAVCDFEFVDVNARGLDLLRIRHEDLVGARLCELLPVNREQGFFERYVAVHETGEPLEEEFDLRRRDGTSLRLRHRVVRATDGLVISTRDVTELARSTREQEELGRLLAAIVQSSPLAIQALDRDGRVTMWNPAAERLFGFREDEVLGRTLPTVPDELHDEFERIRLAVLDGTETTLLETQCRHKDGTCLDVAISLAPLRDERGAVAGHVAMIADVSARRRLEHRVAQAQKLEALGQLASGIAHDFNNLLTTITGYAELVRARLPRGASELQADVDQLQAAAEEGTELTRELLAFARPREERMEETELVATVAEAESFLRRALGNRAELVLELGEPCVVRLSAAHVRHLLVNLVVNARDAMPDGGTVTVTTARTEMRAGADGAAPGRYCRLRVADTGVGMPPEVLERALQPFFTTKPEGRGTGLGLAIVHSTVVRVGGRVAIDSAPGRGTEVTLYLPSESPERVTVLAPSSSTQGARRSTRQRPPSRR